MTGRRAGYCAGHDVPGYMNDAVPPMGMGRGRGRGFGRGGGRGRGFGRGPGWGYGPDPGYQVPVFGPSQPLVRPEDEVGYLEGCAQRLEEDLKAVKERLAELRKE